MESSDDSFAWTNCSSSSENSGTIATEMIKGEQDRFESDVDYKKKLHKKLFKESKSGDEKVKRELLSAVKAEPESSEEGASPRRRRGHPARVKREREDTEHISTNSNSNGLENTVHNGHELKDETLDGDQELRVKKKKSKRKKYNSEQHEETMIVEDKFHAEETVVESPRHMISSGNNMRENDDGENKTDHISSRKKKKKRNTNEEINPVPGSPSSTDRSQYERNRKSSKISDFLQFEEEVDLPTEREITNPETLQDSTSMSARLKRFLKRNAHLQPVPSEPQEQPMLSHHDETWLLHCPTEIDLESFRDRDLSLDTKCKIKIDSQTYVGNVEYEADRVPVLIFENSKAILKNSRISGTIKLHKRIPKAHISEDNHMINNQTDFIPLPDTKCRHPLFGPDYKKAMKICSAVKARLKDAFAESVKSSAEKKKKKKYKKEKEEEETKMEERKRKRKAAGAEPGPDEPARKQRRRDRAPAAPRTWDSEKAIAENLFNF